MASMLATLLAISVVSLPQTGNGLPTEDPACNGRTFHDTPTFESASHECNCIRYSINTSPENKTVVVVVAPRMKSLNVTLDGDDCELSCVDNVCRSEPRKYEYILRITEGDTEKFIFPNIKSNYFCGTISTDFDDCKLMGTDTMSHPNENMPFEPPESKVNFLMILGAVFCLFLVVISALLLSMKKTSLMMVVPSDESDGFVEAAFSEESSTALLLYSRDSPAFLNLMAAFRELLATAAGIQVLDPLDSSRFEEVARNPSGWLSRELVNPRTKVIIVVSNAAILRQKALLSNRRVENPEPHFLDGIFTQGLRHLHDNPYDSSNYSRIFTVRFEDVMTLNDNLSLIVPLRCFNLPRHLTNLICEVKGLSCDQFASMEDLQRSPALARLQEQLHLAAMERRSANEE